jgi:hypothetical protein
VACVYYEPMGDEDDPPLLFINELGQCTNYRVEWCEMFVAGLPGHPHGQPRRRPVDAADDVTPDLSAVLAAIGTGEPPPLAYTLADGPGRRSPC